MKPNKQRLCFPLTESKKQPVHLFTNGLINQQVTSIIRDIAGVSSFNWKRSPRKCIEWCSSTGEIGIFNLPTHVDHVTVMHIISRLTNVMFCWSIVKSENSN